MAESPQYGVHSEPRSGHWVAWVTRDGQDGPAGSVLLVGQTQDEAERNAQQWLERLTADPTLRRD